LSTDGSYAERLARVTVPPELALVSSFVNTLDVESGADEIARPEGLATWLREQRLILRETAVGGEDVARASGLREAVRQHLVANNGGMLDPSAADALEGQARRSLLGVELRGGHARLVAGADGVDGALGSILAAVATAMLEGTWPRLKACAADTCRWAFVDRSNNQSRHWCTMRVCGNREKVRAYRARQASPPFR
jgi:predicted RNA-binding Zn ribbon-like protein